MAPKAGNKRAAAASPRKAKKSRVDPAREKCEAVVDALESLATQLPKPVRNMLSKAAPDCLTVLAEKREKCQVDLVSMIGDALMDVEKRMHAAVAEKQAPANAALAEKATLAEAVTNAENELASMQEATTNAKRAAGEKMQALQAAKEELAKAESAQKTGDAEVLKAEASKVALEATRSDVLEPLRERASDSKDTIRKLVQVGKQCGFEEALLTSMPGAFEKAPAERGTFDQMIFTQYEAALNKKIEALAQELVEGQPARTERQSTVLGCKAVLDERNEEVEAGKTSLGEATSNERAAKDALAVAKRALAEFEPQIRERMRALVEAKAECTEFCEGALAGFNFLKELAPAAPPAPAEAEAPPATE